MINIGDVVVINKGITDFKQGETQTILEWQSKGVALVVTGTKVLNNAWSLPNELHYIASDGNEEFTFNKIELSKRVMQFD